MDIKTFSPVFGEQKPQEIEGSLPVKQAEITVIGSGVFGSWTALMLLREGYKVTLADGWGAGNSRSSSGGESRLMRKLYGSHDYYYSMARESARLWKSLENEAKSNIYTEDGIYWFFKDDQDPYIYNNSGELYDFLSDDIIEVGVAEVKHWMPGIDLTGVSKVFKEPEAGYLKARRAVEVVKNQFIKEGGKFISSHFIPGKKESQRLGFCLGANNSTVRSDLFIFACGPWLNSIFPELKNVLTVTRQDVLYFGYPSNYYRNQTEKDSCWVEWDPENLFYGIPFLEGRGFKIALDERGPEIDPTTEDRTPDQNIISRSKEYFKKRFPFLGSAPVVEHRVCQYTNTDDGNFIIQPHPELHNVWLLGGGSGHGFKHGPAIGQMVANIFKEKKELPGIFKKY